MMSQPQSTPPPLLDTLDHPQWARRRDIALTLLLWLLLLAAGIWLLAHVAHAAIILALSILLAYALVPPVQLLSRYLPRWLAIIIVYLAILGALGALGYSLLNTALTQFAALAQQAGSLITSPNADASSPLIQQLQRLGLSESQIQSAQQQVISQVEAISTGAVPWLGTIVNGTINAVLDIILVVVLSLYFLIDGRRAVLWLRSSASLRWRPGVSFLLNTVERVVGGYIRGQLFMSTFMGLIVGLGMAVLQVPYAVLLGMLAFVTEFIPVLGSLFAGVVCVLVALTQGWFLALIVLAYFIVVHILDGYVISPRVVGHAVGLHPIVAITALVAAGDVFGIFGALFAAPIAGLIQALLAALWIEWREMHPNQFPESSGSKGVPLTGAEQAKHEPTLAVAEHDEATSRISGQ
ncbi:MAG: AI-2E family transporter [Ktedonobacterales bacterium]